MSLPPLSLPGEPVWLKSANLIWGGAAAVLLVLLMGAAFSAIQRREVIQEELHRTQLLARLLENETTRTLDATATTMAMIVHRIQSSENLSDSDLSNQLSESVRGLPYLRSLSVLDSTGRVRASSNPAMTGHSIDLRMLGAPSNNEEVWLGPWLPGRDLSEIDSIHGALNQRTTVLPGVGVITLLRRQDALDGRGFHLVAAINPDYLSNNYQQILSERTLAAALLDYQGRVLTSTEGIRHLPGSSIQGHKALLDYLPDQEYGGYQGLGVDGGQVITAFRANRKLPLLVVVEESTTVTDAIWHGKLGWALAAMLASSLVIMAAALAGWRSLRAHEILSTALDRTRTSLEDSERHLRAVIEAAPAPMFVLDPDGAFAIVNQAFEDLLGVRRDALIGHHAENNPTLQLLAYHPVRDAGLWSGSGHSNYLEGVTTVGGVQRQALVAKVALRRPNGRPAGVIGSITDVTSFRNAERRAAQAMAATEAAYRAESEFIAHLSFALRTPLQSILGFSELGMNRTTGKSGLSGLIGLHDMFTNIHIGSQRMLQVVDDLLDLSRLKNAAGTLHFADADTLKLAEEVVGHAREEARIRDIDITLTATTTETIAEVAALRLQQALRTLIERAVRVSHEHSRIEVRVTRDNHPDAADVLHWWIQDAGPRISISDREDDDYPFTTMFSATASRMDEINGGSGSGSGLELTICREILRSHGGDVQCMNHPSGGNTFHLMLPTTQPETTGPSDLSGKSRARNLRSNR